MLTQVKKIFLEKSSCYDKTVLLLTNSLPLGDMSVSFVFASLLTPSSVASSSQFQVLKKTLHVVVVVVEDWAILAVMTI